MSGFPDGGLLGLRMGALGFWEWGMSKVDGVMIWEGCFGTGVPGFGISRA